MRIVRDHDAYTLRSLADEAGMGYHAVRKLRRLGVIPPPYGGRTRAARFGSKHLEVLREYRRVVVDGRVTAAEFGERLAAR